MKMLTCLAPAGALFLVTTAAHADETPDHAPVIAADGPAAPPATPAKPSFGASGTLVLDDILGFGLSSGASLTAMGASTSFAPTGWVRFDKSSANGPDGTTSQSSAFGIAPSIHYFVADRLSLGAQLRLFEAQARGGSYEASTVGGALRPRVGWALPLTTGLALWPSAYGEVSTTRTSGGGSGVAAKSVALGWGVGADALLVAPLGRFVALTFGPSLGYGKVDLIDGEPSGLGGGTRTSTISFSARGGIAIVL